MSKSLLFQLSKCKSYEAMKRRNPSYLRLPLLASAS